MSTWSVTVTPPHGESYTIDVEARDDLEASDKAWSEILDAHTISEPKEIKP